MTDHIVDINKKVLSPGAQAVMDAVVSQPSFATRKRVAAALCAVADQVASPIPDDCRCDVFNRQLDIRADILATELEWLQPLPNPDVTQ